MYRLKEVIGSKCGRWQHKYSRYKLDFLNHQYKAQIYIAGVGEN